MIVVVCTTKVQKNEFVGLAIPVRIVGLNDGRGMLSHRRQTMHYIIL